MEGNSFENKEQFIDVLTELWDNAYNAYLNYHRLQEYKRLSHEYPDEMNQSRNYYCMEYYTTYYTMFMELAKLYVQNRDSITLQWLLTRCIKTNMLPEYCAEYTLDGVLEKELYYCKIRSGEEPLFKDEKIKKAIQSQREENIILEHAIIKESTYATEEEKDSFVEISLSVKEILHFYNSKLSKMEDAIIKVKI